jgi:hypothetical protein
MLHGWSSRWKKNKVNMLAEAETLYWNPLIQLSQASMALYTAVLLLRDDRRRCSKHAAPTRPSEPEQKALEALQQQMKKHSKVKQLFGQSA